MTDDTLLHRQIHPTFNPDGPDGEVTSQAFRPSEEHAWKLSVYDGGQMTPEASWKHYTSAPDHISCGVLSVTPRECAALQLPVRPSPEVFAEHVDIDFTSLTAKWVLRKGKLLRDKAVTRGWQFRPQSQRGISAG